MWNKSTAYKRRTDVQMPRHTDGQTYYRRPDIQADRRTIVWMYCTCIHVGVILLSYNDDTSMTISIEIAWASQK